MIRLTDRERILTHIIHRLWTGDGFPDLGAHFRGGFKHKLIPDDIVLGTGLSGLCPHPFSVAIVVKPMPEISGALVRDMVTGETCTYGNEHFAVIDGIDRTNEVFLCGRQRAFYEKVVAAFNRAPVWSYRYGGIRFVSDHEAVITVRCVFNGLKNVQTEEAIPFEVPIRFTARTSVKAVLATLRAGGYGTHEFVYQPRMGKP